MKKIIILLAAALLLAGCQKEAEPAEAIDVKETIQREEAEETSISHIDTDKKESIYAKADPYGKVYRKEVEVILKAYEGESVEDISDLTDIRNTHSDETFQKDGEHLIFENKGEDIHYKGNSSKDLPVSLRITYSLDGKEISAEELAGKSGKLTMRFDYVNNTSVSSDGYSLIDPLLAMTAVPLDSAVFSNVHAENGRIIELGEEKILLITAFPGFEEALHLSGYELTKDISLDSHAVLEADVQDFSLGYTATILSGGLFKDLEDKDLNRFLDFAEDTASFKSDAGKLKENTSALYDASRQLNSGITQYTKAAEEIASGASALKQGSEALKNGLSLLLSSLTEGNTSLEEDISSFSEKLVTLETQVKTYEGSAAAIKESLPSLKELVSSSSASDEEKNAILAVLSSYDDTLKALPAIDIDPINTSFSQIGTSLSSLSDGISSLSENLKTLSQGADDLYTGISSLEEALTSLTGNNTVLTQGSSALLGAAKEFDNGMKDFVDNDLNDLLKLGGSSLKDLTGRIRALKKIDENRGCFSGLMEGKTGESVFIIETDSIH